MQLRTFDSVQDFTFFEIQRLAELLPQELQSKVVIESAKQAGSKSVITCSTKQKELSVQINFSNWQLFSVDQRNLLFWDEIANIQSSRSCAIVKDKVFKIALISLFVELFSQNLAGAIVALIIVSLGMFDLYQKKWGEQFFKKITAADRDAVEMAKEFGYSLTQAQDSLYSAIELLVKYKFSQDNLRRDQVRLRVLEMMRAEPMQPFNQSHFKPRANHALLSM